MPDVFTARYRITAWWIVLMLGTIALLAWFTSIFVIDASYKDLVRTAHRGRWLADLPRPVVIATFGGITLLVAGLLILQLIAVRSGRVLCEIDDRGVTHTGLLGGRHHLDWEHVASASYQGGSVVLKRAAGAPGPRQVGIPFVGQDRDAIIRAIRTRRPRLAPPT